MHRRGRIEREDVTRLDLSEAEQLVTIGCRDGAIIRAFGVFVTLNKPVVTACLDAMFCPLHLAALDGNVKHAQALMEKGEVLANNFLPSAP